MLSFRYYLNTNLYRVDNEYIDISSELIIPSGPISMPTMRYDSLFYSHYLFDSINGTINFNVHLGATTTKHTIRIIIQILDRNGAITNVYTDLFRSNDPNGEIFEKTLTLNNYKDFFNPEIRCFIAHEDSDTFPNTVHISIDCIFDVQRSIKQCHPVTLGTDELCSIACSCVTNGSFDTCTPCRDTYISQCFLNSGSNSETEFTETCYNYFQNYLFYKGPDEELDTYFYNYCNSRYKTIEEKVNDPVCACHLDQQFYQNIVDNLKNLGFSNIDKVFVGDRTRCILPQCANSNFPDRTVGIHGCQGVRCINAIIVNGDNIDYRHVKINQSGKCVNICSPGLKCN
jgi:hypothetical protein